MESEVDRNRGAGFGNLVDGPRRWCPKHSEATCIQLLESLEPNGDFASNPTYNQRPATTAL